jgi:EAL domain-containing protein (putative c-di-GMP-specific phosphodiesterase class I)
VALYPTHASDPETLLAYADAAMYQAKQTGKNNWRMYQPERDSIEANLAVLTWRERISVALESGLFGLLFQGVYAMPERRLVHLEALLRMRDERTGQLVLPNYFIPIAERSGQIVEIDRWVIRECIRQLQRNPVMPPIAINVSGRTFDDPDMPRYIAEQLKAHGVEPGRLMVELTETAALSDLIDAERFIRELRELGCRICLDDFGAGFASFAYLKHIVVDTIKIDGMFIRDLAHDEQSQVFVRAMLEMARGLGVSSVAECVEDEATLEVLREFGVDMVQGYHLDRPQADHAALG